MHVVLTFAHFTQCSFLDQNVYRQTKQLQNISEMCRWSLSQNQMFSRMESIYNATLRCKWKQLGLILLLLLESAPAIWRMWTQQAQLWFCILEAAIWPCMLLEAGGVFLHLVTERGLLEITIIQMFNILIRN